MPRAKISGTQLFYELSGAGEIPLVFVHGSWVSHHTWDSVVAKLSESCRVLAYDRRGHSQSDPPTGEGSLREDVTDLAALIEHLDLAPSWAISNSGGGLVTLRLAGERPELFRGLIAHEPPLWSLIADDPAAGPMREVLRSVIGAVSERIVSGDHAGAAEMFVETVIARGMWEQLPPDSQQTFIRNAPTVLDEFRDPDVAGPAGGQGPPFDLSLIQPFPHPVLLTTGEQSPPTFAPVIAKLADALPESEVATIPGAGHVPQFTHPDAYAQVIMTFVSKNSE